MKGRLKEYALVAEIVGAIAVVISLIYVGVGVRQNTEAVQVANHQAIVAMDISKNSWLRDPQFAAAHALAREDFEKVTPEQLSQLRAFMADQVNIWEFAFITHSNGAMSDNIWEGFDSFYRTEIQSKLGRWFWDRGGANFSPQFADYVNSIINASGSELAN